MDRRNILTLAATGTALAACGGTGGFSLPSININIPDELKDALAAIAKLDGLRNLLPASVGVFIDRGKDLVSAITGAVSADGMKVAGGQLVTLLEGLLPSLVSSNSTVKMVVSAIETLLPFMASAVGMQRHMAARRSTGMSVPQARQVLRG